jgi:hypothetical protein
MASVSAVVTDCRTLVLLVPKGVADGARGTVLGAMSTATANVALRFFITATREVLVGSAVFTLRGVEVRTLALGVLGDFIVVLATRRRDDR